MMKNEFVGVKAPMYVTSLKGKLLARIHFPSPYSNGEFIVIQKHDYYTATHKLGNTILANWKALGKFPKQR
tara:strand:- start:291 stop:503 length:213 start_codon:yes stop_codon:yes gene_type:complete